MKNNNMQMKQTNKQKGIIKNKSFLGLGKGRMFKNHHCPHVNPTFLTHTQMICTKHHKLYRSLMLTS